MAINSDWHKASYDISPFAAPLNIMRFTTSNRMSRNAQFVFDNIEISYQPIPTEILRDEFSTIAYENNDGSVNWTGNWVETNDQGGAVTGAAPGKIGRPPLPALINGWHRSKRWVWSRAASSCIVILLFI